MSLSLSLSFRTRDNEETSSSRNFEEEKFQGSTRYFFFPGRENKGQSELFVNHLVTCALERSERR